MSAYIVEKATIDAILTFALTGRQKFGTIKRIAGDNRPGEYTVTTDYDINQIGQALWDENVRSVNARYSEQSEFEAYKFKALHKLPGKDGRYLAPIDIIKICQCLEYQSCEHDGWQDSFAKDFLDRVVSAAIRCLPGYEDAPWGLR